MNIGPLELAFLMIVSLLTIVAVWRTKRRWLGALPLFVVVAILASPADIASTLAISIPNGILYIIAVSRALRSHSDSMSGASTV